MINRIVKALADQNIELNHREIAEAIWLALKMYEMEQSQTDKHDNFANNKQLQNNLSEPIISNGTDSQETSLETELDYKKESSNTNIPLHIAKNQQNTNTNNEQSPKSTPTKIPTAKALPNQLEIARALKPLLKKIDSKTEYVIDEQATVRRIKEEREQYPFMTNL